jgi:Spy/CpxP family protein refolding chaperone
MIARLMLGSLALVASLALAPVASAQDTPPTPPAPGGGTAPTPPPPAPGGGGEQGGERRERRGGRGMGLQVDQLKEELGLTDAQVAEVEKLSTEMREKAREMFQSGQGFEGMRGMMEEAFGKVEALLTPEQKTKFADVRAKMQERMQGRMGGRGGEGGPGGRGGRGPQLKERLREDALKVLALSQEEAAVVTPRLDTVLETRDLTQREAQRAREEFMTKVRETADQAALQKLLADYRTARESGKSQEKTAMDGLRELLTVEQEAKLVGLGILD